MPSEGLSDGIFAFVRGALLCCRLIFRRHFVSKRLMSGWQF
ncbi:TPA: hypothetical protein ACQUJH_001201 [Neisseria cinerea]